ncbi:hypothetical protein TWF730_000718 [Orbilia blumenaviensis]|uniref:NB-ARC domain-containing protein n=1 Tax=Orbilia blumenaviensis TaxID=1796055 RepID=A0AAV9VPE0_9PEZI
MDVMDFTMDGDEGEEEPSANTTFNNQRNHTMMQAGIVNNPTFNITQGGIHPMKKTKFSYDVSLDLPFPRNRNFTSRRTELEAIDIYFSGYAYGGAPIYAITGTGGVGKTQIALEYAYTRYAARRFTAIFWISTATEESIQGSFLEIMQQIIDEQARASWPEPFDYETIGMGLGVSGLIDGNGRISRDSDPSLIQSALFNWFKLPGNDKWLLIFDNADDLSFGVDKYFPNRGGYILVTSRRPEFSHCAEQANLDGLDEESATNLLLHLARLRSPTQNEIQQATEVVKKLGFLPLAITHAGCFIHEMNIPMKEYLRYYDNTFKEAQSKIPKVGWLYREDTAVTTWEISFAEIQKQDEQAAAILLTCGYLRCNNIPETLWGSEDGKYDPVFEIQRKFIF